MKKKTRRLLNFVENNIRETYPFLSESEQKDIMETFIYNALLSEIIDTTRTVKRNTNNVMFNPDVYQPVEKVLNAYKLPLTPEGWKQAIRNPRIRAVLAMNGIDVGFGTSQAISRGLGTSSIARHLGRNRNATL